MRCFLVNATDKNSLTSIVPNSPWDSDFIMPPSSDRFTSKILLLFITSSISRQFLLRPKIGSSISSLVNSLSLLIVLSTSSRRILWLDSLSHCSSLRIIGLLTRDNTILRKFDSMGLNSSLASQKVKFVSINEYAML